MVGAMSHQDSSFIVCTIFWGCGYYRIYCFDHIFLGGHQGLTPYNFIKSAYHLKCLHRMIQILIFFSCDGMKRLNHYMSKLFILHLCQGDLRQIQHFSMLGQFLAG